MKKVDPMQIIWLNTGYCYLNVNIRVHNLNFYMAFSIVTYNFVRVFIKKGYYCYYCDILWCVYIYIYIYISI